MADDNAQRGSFLLNGIPPAPRGVPQIEITYEIDADGILNVTAKELSTGINQSIIINVTMKMSDSEIEHAIEEANEYAEADERKYKLAQLRNEADSAIYASEKFIFDPEFRDEILPSDIGRIETLVVGLKEAVQLKMSFRLL